MNGADNRAIDSHLIIVQRLALAPKDGCLGVISLHRPEQLNAINIEIAQAILDVLVHWRNDPEVIAVLICGTERAFSAGGDVKLLYRAFTEGRPIEARRYIDAVYQLILSVVQYPKPVIGYCDSLAMGMGLGLLMACHQQVVSPNAILAMPETAIGVYPDGAASYFFQKMPMALAYLLTISGTAIVGNDACSAGLLNGIWLGKKHFISEKSFISKNNFIDEFKEGFSQEKNITNDLFGLLSQNESSAPMECLPLAEKALSSLIALTASGSVSIKQTHESLVSSFHQLLQPVGGKALTAGARQWWEKMQNNLRYASPLAMLLSAHQLFRSYVWLQKWQQEKAGANKVSINKISLNKVNLNKVNLNKLNISADFNFSSRLAVAESNANELSKNDFSTVMAAICDQEMELSKRIADQSDEMREGVRALLIERDRQPKWRFDSLEKIDVAWVEERFFL